MGIKRILIVDDSKALAMLASKKLHQQLDCETVLAHSLAEAREAIAQSPTPFFVAVLDLTLPDAPQGEVVDMVVQQGIRSIVLTGTFGEEWRETLLAKNVVDYVIKKDIHDFDYIAMLIDRLDRNASIKTLVVDDSSSYRNYITRLLRTQNFQVQEACDGEQGLAMLEADEEIRLVITDYLMPKMDGIEMVGRIREKWGPDRLAVIGASSENDPVVSARFLKTGVSDFLNKPFTTEEFNCRIQHNIERIERVVALRDSLETKNRFLGIAAHDLRNPLGGIKGFSTLLIQEKFGPLAPKQKELLNHVLTSSKQMLGMINDLLDISVIESGNLNLRCMDSDLVSLIQDRLHQSRLLAEPKEICIETEFAAVPLIPCDPNRFSQILDNLLSNAIKYSQPGSCVTVRLLREEHQLRLQVQDQGQGISEAEQKKLFRHFQRLSSTPTAGEQSTGLGLAIVKRMVEAHGWRITARSELGQGSVFEVLIPLPL